jgi:proteasome lid subunit RPN8/RPN11
MELNSSSHEAFEKHAISVYPQECCGLLLDDGEYLSCVNKHPDPTKSFRIDPMVLVEMDGRMKAVLHSHPYNPSHQFPVGFLPQYPSMKDIDCFNKTGLPWGIAATDGTGISELVWMDESVIPPLLGRKFVWGVTDCFSLGRDYYKLNYGITFPNVPRPWGFWDDLDNSDFIVRYFESCGFYEVPFEKAQIGDGLLIRMGDTKCAGAINHIGVITGPNEFMHQVAGSSYSRKARLDIWRRSVAKVVRYKENLNKESS